MIFIRELMQGGHTDEQALRKHISDLQEYRQAGLTTFAEVDKYEKEKSQRVCQSL